MKTIINFKVNAQLEEVIKKESAGIESGVFNFKYVTSKTNLQKALKLIANAIEDSWAVHQVHLEEDKAGGIIQLQVSKRKKQQFMFPNGDQHFNRNKDRYQYHTFLAALSLIKQTRTAIDIGGHIGFYSSAMLDVFKQVEAFEPSPINAKCFVHNVPKANLNRYGLGEQNQKVKLHLAEDNSGNSSIVEEFGHHAVEIEIKTLDSFNFNNIDLIKIDVQGYEEQVLLGAKETILKNKPVIIAELITHKNSPPNQAALKILDSYHYKTSLVMGKDYILTPY